MFCGNFKMRRLIFGWRKGFMAQAAFEMSLEGSAEKEASVRM